MGVKIVRFSVLLPSFIFLMCMKTIVFALLTSLIITASAMAQSFEWGVTSKAGITVSPSGMVTDAAGNSTVIGSFFSAARFDTIYFTPQARDIFVTHYNAAGKQQWVRRFGSTADDFGNAVAVDPKGNIYITGAYTYSMPMDKDTLKFGGDFDIFVAKLDSKGTVQWARSAGWHASDFATAVAADKDGNCVIAGYFRDSATFGSIKLAGFSSGLYTMFLAKYDKNGTCLWAKALGGSNYQSQMEGIGLDIDPKGNIYIAGSLHGEGRLDTAKIMCKGTTDLFVLKYSPSGKYEWAKTAGASTGVLVCKSLKWSQSSLYLTGHVVNMGSFDGGKTNVIARLGFSDVYVAKYSDNGEFQWVQQGSGHGVKSGEAITADQKGNVYVTGNFADTLRFGGTTLSNNGKLGYFGISFAPDGKLRWARQAGRVGTLLPHGIGVDKNGNSYYTGTYNDTADFGKIRLISQTNAQDMYLVKLSATSPWSVTKTSDVAPAKTEITSFEFDKAKKKIVVLFNVVGSAYSKLDLTSILGSTAESFLEEELSTGSYKAEIDVKGIASDVYYFRTQVGPVKLTKRVEL